MFFCTSRLQSTPAGVRIRRRTVKGGINVSLCVGCDLSLSRLNNGTYFYVGNRPGNIVVVADLRSMTEVTTTCAKSLRLEKSDGARVQLMIRMRGAQSEIGDSYVSDLGDAWKN